MIVPVTRKEKLLNAIATSGNVDFSPKTREELFLFKILGADVNAPTPITRKELLYQHIIDGTLPTFEPRTRLEKFIMVAAGAELELPVVLTREEYWWAEISDSAYETITGAIVHFISKRARAIKSLIANIAYTQDLNGYDSPWPAGGGKNLLDSSTNTKNKLINDQGEIVTNNAIQITDFIPVSASTAYVLSGTGLNGSGSADVRVNYYDSNKTWKYRSGTNKNNGLQFTTDSDTAYVRHSYSNNATNEQLELGTTATSYAPYSNICPISGWTGANINVAGFNWWDEQSESGGINDETGAKISQSGQTRSKNYIPVLPGTIYYLYSEAGGSVWGYMYDADKNFVGRAKAYPGNQNNISNSRFETSANVRYILFKAFTTTFNKKICINISDSAENGNYAPYQGNTYSITFPSEAGTVYGGTLDVVTGELTVTHAEKIFVGADSESWARDPGNSNLNRYRIGVNGKQQTQRWPVACNEGVYPDSFSVNDVGTVFVSAGRLFFYPLPSINTVSLFKAWLADNPLQVVYELAEPITYQLTPTEVTTLLGDNTIWADTGDVSVTY